MYQIISAMSTFDVRGPEIRRTLMADVFDLYRPALPGARIDLALEGPMLGEGLPALDAAATVTPQGTWLFLANRSLDRAATVSLTGLPGLRDGVMRAATSPYDLQAPPEPARLTGSRVELPPLSLTRLQAS